MLIDFPVELLPPCFQSDLFAAWLLLFNGYFNQVMCARFQVR